MAPRWAYIVVGLASGAGPNAQAASPPSISVTSYNCAGVDPRTLARAKAKVTRIYRDENITVTWMDPGAAKPTGSFAIQLVIRRTAVKVAGPAMGTAIGGTHETGGLAFIDYDRALQSSHKNEQDVATLVGYAIAHEMGHLLLPYPAHSSSGIMRPAWNGDDLRQIATGTLRFTAVQADMIRAKVSECCTAASTGAGSHLRGIRTLEPSVSAIVHEGQRGSATFAALIERIEQSDTLVYIVRVHTLPHRMEGSLVHEPAYSGARYLKIALAMGTPSERLIAVVAHELQHVCEVLDAGVSTDGAALDALFARIGTRQLGTDAGEQYETAAAQEVEKIVIRDLSATKRGDRRDRHCYSLRSAASGFMRTAARAGR